LPEFRKERDLQSDFRQYCTLSSSILVGLNKAYKDMQSIQEVKEDSGFRSAVTNIIKRAISKAKKLHKDISEDARAVAKTASKNALRDLGEGKTSANSACLNYWNKKIQVELENWGEIASALENITRTGGKEFKRALDDLGRHRDSIPQDKVGIEKYKATELAISTGISKLNLDGKFGQFLTDVVNGKATTSQLSVPEIKKVMDEHKLWDKFKVRLN